MEINKFHLRVIPTPQLTELMEQVRDELKHRRVLTKSYRIADNAINRGAVTDVKHSSVKVLKDLTNAAKRNPRMHPQALAQLLEQDWSHIYPETHSDTRYYVYAHVNPRQKAFHSNTSPLNLDFKPFYIGKGCGDRAFDLKRNDSHGLILRELKGLGFTDSNVVRILHRDLTEAKALELEAKLIYFFGSAMSTDKGTSGFLVNLAAPKVPIFS